jgi:hypothetical protein
MVDALRYELGRELAHGLRRVHGETAVEIEAAVASAPTITPVGMASLCPGASEGLHLQLEASEKLVVAINGGQVTTPTDRLALLRAAHGEVADLVLDDVFELSEAQLREQVEPAGLVVVRSQEIDEAGEAGKTGVALAYFGVVLEQIRRAIGKLAQVGVTRFVVSSDHGFLILSRDVGSHRLIPKPGGRGEQHRRVFIGTGGTAGQELLRVSLAAVGLVGDLDLLVPRGLALMVAGGDRRFFHGGLSPQELLVPVITVEVKAKEPPPMLEIQAALAGKITSGIFSGRVALKADLFATGGMDVQVSAVRIPDGEVVARVVAAGGAEVGQGIVHLTPTQECLISFQVVRPLTKGEKVELRVLDPKTDRQLAKSKPAQVAADVVVDGD